MPSDSARKGLTMTFSKVGDETGYSAYFLERSGINRNVFEVSMCTGTQAMLLEMKIVTTKMGHTV